MEKYCKIKTLWKREDKKPHNMIIGQFANLEFASLKNIEWVATEKLDGTNIRVIWDGHKVKFKGRTYNSQIQTHLLNRLNELFGGEINEQMFEQIFGENKVCLYGEGIGPKIQKVGSNYGNVDFVMFDIKIGNYWLRRKEVEDISSKLSIKVAPVVFRGTLEEISDFVKEGFYSNWGNFICEGVVARPSVELTSRLNGRIITKLKHKDFLKLKNN